MHNFVFLLKILPEMIFDIFLLFDLLVLSFLFFVMLRRRANGTMMDMSSVILSNEIQGEYK